MRPQEENEIDHETEAETSADRFADGLDAFIDVMQRFHDVDDETVLEVLTAIQNRRRETD